MPSALFYLDRTQDQVAAEAISVSYGRDFAELRASIAQIGIVSPLLVRRAGLQWQIISGKGRWLVSDCVRLPAIELHCTEREAFDFHIHDNLARGFNPIECARIFQKLQEQFGEPSETLVRYARLLKLPEGVRTILDHLALLRLPSRLIDKIASNALSLRSGSILLDFPPDEALLLSDLSDKLRLSAATQREVFTLVWELAHRDNKTVIGLLQQPELRSFIETDYANSGQAKAAGEIFFRQLHTIKNPRLTQAEQAFEQVLHEQHCQSPLIISPAPSFEKEEISVEFRCKSAASFRKMVALLHQLEQSQGIEKLFQITQHRE